jgi:hypothetical protein
MRGSPGATACGHAWRIATHRLHERFYRYERLVEIGRQMRRTQCRTWAAISRHVLRQRCVSI